MVGIATYIIKSHKMYLILFALKNEWCLFEGDLGYTRDTDLY